MPYWNFQEYISPIANGLTIYCGDTDLKSDDGEQFMDDTNPTQRFIFKLEGHKRDGKHVICNEDTSYANTISGTDFWINPDTGELEEKDLHLVVLCDGVLRSKRGFTADATDIESVVPGTYTALHRKGITQPGGAYLQFHDELEWVLSTTLLHEFFHVSWGEMSKFLLFLAWLGT
jgi:hypothetical protein